MFRDRIIFASLVGKVFGSKDPFSGLGIFFDTYSNQNGEHSVSTLCDVFILIAWIMTLYLAAF